MTLNHVDNIESGASYLKFDFTGLSCGIESTFITTMISVGAGGAVPVVTPKRTGGSPGVIKITGLWQLGSYKNVTYIITTAVTNRRFLKTFLQRSDEQSTRECW